MLQLSPTYILKVLLVTVPTFDMMTTRQKRLASAKGQDSAGDKEDKHGGDTEASSSEFETFVRDQLQRILDGQRVLQEEVRSLEENLEKMSNC